MMYRLIILMLITSCVKAQSHLNISALVTDNQRDMQVVETPDTGFYYVLWGQSNMVGRDSVVNIDQSYLQDTIPGVQITYGGSTFYSLVPGRNEPFQINGEFGPDVSLGDTLYKSLGRTVYFLKYAIGGTRLAPQVTSDWNPASEGEYFDGLLARIDAMETSLQNIGLLPKLVAIIGMQGEGDAMDLDDANDYQTNMDYFIDSIRTYITNTGVPFVFGKVYAPDATYRTTVRTAQETICRYELDGSISDTGYTNDNTYLIETDGYTLRDDNLHFDASSTVQFGWDIFTILNSIE